MTAGSVKQDFPLPKVRVIRGCPGCAGCVAVCRAGAIRMNHLVPEIAAALCSGCGACVTFCPTESLCHDA